MKNAKKKTLNQAQLKATANIFLDVTKAVILAVILGWLYPQTSGKIGYVGTIIGLTVGGTSYIFSIIILKRVKDL